MTAVNILDMYHGDDNEALPDFAALKALGIIAIFHKCTQGGGYFDPKYSARRDAAIAAGMPFAAYHFLDASDPIAQAKHFQAGMTAVPLKTAALIPIIADYEKTASTPTLQQLYQFMSQMDGDCAPAQSIVYSSDLIRETLKPHPGGQQNAAMLNVETFFAAHRLWLAEYGPHDNCPWPWADKTINPNPKGVWVWQFSGTGREPGIIGQVDLNYYAGSSADLAADWLN